MLTEAKKAECPTEGCGQGATARAEHGERARHRIEAISIHVKLLRSSLRPAVEAGGQADTVAIVDCDAAVTQHTSTMTDMTLFQPSGRTFGSRCCLLLCLDELDPARANAAVRRCRSAVAPRGTRAPADVGAAAGG